MKKYYFFLVCIITMSCAQRSSNTEEEYIKNLEEKNRILEQELSETRSTGKPATNTKVVKQEINNSKDYFTIGSTEDEVLEVMGDPTSYNNIGSQKMFQYGYSIVTFQNGKVESYSNIEENLKVRVK